MTPAKMNDAELLSKAKELAHNERKIQVDLLWHLLEIQRRKLFLERGFPSLFEYAVKELGYSHSAVYRRVQAMRLLESVPEVANKIKTGAINLSTATQIQNFIKNERKNGGEVNFKRRLEMISAIENKSARDVEKHLISLKPENVIRTEKIRMVTPEIIEMRLMIPDDLKEKMDKLRQVFSHRVPDMTYLALLDYLVTQALGKVEKKQKSLLPVSRSITSGPENKDRQEEVSRSARDQEVAAAKCGEVRKFLPKSLVDNVLAKRNIPPALRHAVWLRDGGVCSYHDPHTGRKCGGRSFVQVDHIHPWSKGGENKLENLQLLCAEHNRRKSNRMPPKEGSKI